MRRMSKTERQTRRRRARREILRRLDHLYASRDGRSNFFGTPRPYPDVTAHEYGHGLPGESQPESPGVREWREDRYYQLLARRA